ncbi:MAG: copper transport protein [Pseudonocardiales bacterium]|nr:copper transport protein [Pseudonocardiales bacterium]
MSRRSAPAGVRRLILRVAIWFAGIVLVSLAGAQPASAHAVLVTSDPANGATLAAAPKSVRLWFSEEISDQLSGARLVDHDGKDVAGTHAVAARGDPRLLEVSLPDLSRGTYGVLWRVLAQDDGHTTNGVALFHVGAANGSSAVVAEGAATTGSPIDVARRWLGITALCGLVGGLAVAQLVLGRTRTAGPLSAAIRGARRRLLAFAAGCAGLGLLAGCADLVAEAHATAAPGRSATAVVGDILSSTRWGHLWAVREATLVVLVAVLVRLRVQDRSHDRLTRPLAFVAAGVVAVRVLVEALGSHAAAIRSDRSAALAADALHILTACLWLGGLAALVVVLWSPPTDGAGRGEIVRACRGPFAALVSVSAAVVLVTGLYSAGREVLSVDSLTATPYGRALLVKCALLVALGSVGLVNASRLRATAWPWLRSSGRARRARPLTRRLVLVETAIGAVLLIAVAVIVESAPPRSHAQVAAAATQSQARSGSAADLVVTVSATPNLPGTNGFTVVVASSRRPPPAPVDGLTLTINRSGASRVVPLRLVEPGRYFGTALLDATGDPQLVAVVHRSGQALAVTLAWPLASPGEGTSAPARRLAPIVDALALALLAAIAAAGIVWARRRRAVRAPQVSGEPGETTERVLEPLP